MDTNAKQIGQCLPADVLNRIEGIKAREARTSAALSGSGAGEDRAIPVGEESKTTGDVIDFCMSIPKRTASRHSGPAVVVRFDLDMRRRAHG